MLYSVNGLFDEEVMVEDDCEGGYVRHVKVRGVLGGACGTRERDGPRSEGMRSIVSRPMSGVRTSSSLESGEGRRVRAQWRITRGHKTAVFGHDLWRQESSQR